MYTYNTLWIISCLHFDLYFYDGENVINFPQIKRYAVFDRKSAQSAKLILGKMGGALIR